MTTTPFSPEACWIWGSDDEGERNLWRYFRRRFTVPGPLRRATLLITADSRYECHLNGHYIGRGPVRGFPFNYFYDTYDITPNLRAGDENVIAVLVNHLGDHTMGYIRGRPGLLCEILLEDEQGNESRIPSDANWRTTPCNTFNNDAPRISIQLDFEEQYDARRELTGWDAPPFD